MVANTTITQELHSKYNDVFTGIVCLKGTFSLQVTEGANPYQVPTRCMVYVLHGTLKKEFDRLTEQQIIAPLWVDKMAK